MRDMKWLKQGKSWDRGSFLRFGSVRRINAYGGNIEVNLSRVAINDMYDHDGYGIRT